MILTTTPGIEGRPVKEYLGIVSGEGVVTGNLSDLGTALQNMGSGRGHLSERKLFEAHQVALQKLTERAAELGANAVVGIHLDSEDTQIGMMIFAAGTAVVIP